MRQCLRRRATSCPVAAIAAIALIALITLIALVVPALSPVYRFGVRYLPSQRLYLRLLLRTEHRRVIPTVLADFGSKLAPAWHESGTNLALRLRSSAGDTARQLHQDLDL